MIARLAPQAGALALNANGDAARFSRFGLPVLPDPIEGFPGPLAGVLAGLDWAAGEGAETIVTVAADTPFFPTIWWRGCKAPRRAWRIRWCWPRRRAAMRRRNP